MQFGSSYPAEARVAVEAMLRDTTLTVVEISRRTSVACTTVRRWNRQTRIRPWTREGRREGDPRTWTAGRLSAAARLFGRGDIDGGDLAEAMGARRSEAPALALACGLAGWPARTALAPPGGAPDLATLDAALRGHIAEQIAASSERLREQGAAADTPRVLRDLGGLNRLLDDLAARARQRHRDGDADAEPEPDLAALRERIARRMEAHLGPRQDTDVAGGPGADASQGAGD